MVTDYKLSNNFRLYEFLQSQEAERKPELREKQFNPPEEVIENIQWLVTNVLQPARAFLDCPISISSGYRCLELNSLIGGSQTSQHVKGQAADISLPDYFRDKNKVEADIIRGEINRITGETITNVNASFYLFALFVLRIKGFNIDQVISEYGSLGKPAWVHVSSSRDSERKEILHKLSGQGYVKMTVDEALKTGV